MCTVAQKLKILDMPPATPIFKFVVLKILF